MWLRAYAVIFVAISTFGQTPDRIRGNWIPEWKLVQKVEPVYPLLARQARIQGVVRFTAIIGKDGRIRNLHLVRGHPLLVPAATEAVRQWVYRPTLLNREPVEVVTQIDVPFVLYPGTTTPAPLLDGVA